RIDARLRVDVRGDLEDDDVDGKEALDGHQGGAQQQDRVDAGRHQPPRGVAEPAIEDVVHGSLLFHRDCERPWYCIGSTNSICVSFAALQRSTTWTTSVQGTSGVTSRATGTSICLALS